MEKPAETQFPIQDLIARRWSPRAFEPKALSREQIGALLEAVRWAPSSFNEQPWRLIVAERGDAAAFEAMLGCLLPGNQTWAQHAGLLMVSLAKTRFKRNNRENRHAFHDVGLAMGQLGIQATALGLHLHQMAGIDLDHIRQTYALPDDCEPVAGVAVGYAAEPESLPEGLAERERAPRQRMALKDMVFTGTFGQSWLG